MFPIADLHCDLLAYLAHKEGREIYDQASRASLPQWREGGVRFQTLAVYTPTGSQSVACAEKQFTCFRGLPLWHKEEVVRMTERGAISPIFAESPLPSAEPTPAVMVAAALENASGICGEKEKLDYAFLRLDQYQQMAGPLLYISLTWRGENRFGGGDHTKVGLKRDGELLLEYLEGKQIAIDLSHASDRLAYDILDYLDAHNLSLLPIASHSNFRAVANHPRNLPDPLAQEIIARGGVIGLNFVKFFVGHATEDFLRQIEYARYLGGLGALCLGADFFCERDLHPFLSFFFPRYGNSSCYQTLLTECASLFTQQELSGLAFANFAQFLVRLRGE